MGKIGQEQGDIFNQFLKESERQAKAVAAHSRLTECLENEQNADACNKFAGAWIDGENLAIQITDKTIHGRYEGFFDITGEYDKKALEELRGCIVYKNAQYSLKDLENCRAVIAKTVLKDNVSVTASYIDYPKNKVVFEVLKKDVSGVLKMLGSDYPMVVVEEGAPTAEEVDLFGGNKIFCNDKNGYHDASGTFPAATLGMCGKYLSKDPNLNDNPAIITSAHAAFAFPCNPNGHSLTNLQPGDWIGDYANHCIATVVEIGYGINGDWAIAAINDLMDPNDNPNGNTPTSKVEGVSIQGVKDFPPKGQHCFKYGAGSGESLIEVTETNVYDAIQGRPRICHLVQGKIKRGTSAPGDSGGPYIVFERGFWDFVLCRPKKYKFVGIHHGQGTRTDKVTFTPYDQFKDVFMPKTT